MKMMNRYDVCFAPYANPLIQTTTEVDAGSMEAAADFVRSFSRERVEILSVRAHKVRKSKPGTTFFIRLRGCLRFWK